MLQRILSIVVMPVTLVLALLGDKEKLQHCVKSLVWFPVVKPSGGLVFHLVSFLCLILATLLCSSEFDQKIGNVQVVKYVYLVWLFYGAILVGQLYVTPEGMVALFLKFGELQRDSTMGEYEVGDRSLVRFEGVYGPGVNILSWPQWFGGSVFLMYTHLRKTQHSIRVMVSVYNAGEQNTSEASIARGWLYFDVMLSYRGRDAYGVYNFTRGGISQNGGTVNDASKFASIEDYSHELLESAASDVMSPASYFEIQRLGTGALSTCVEFHLRVGKDPIEALREFRDVPVGPRVDHDTAHELERLKRELRSRTLQVSPSGPGGGVLDLLAELPANTTHYARLHQLVPAMRYYMSIPFLCASVSTFEAETGTSVEGVKVKNLKPSKELAKAFEDLTKAQIAAKEGVVAARGRAEVSRIEAAAAAERLSVVSEAAKAAHEAMTGQLIGPDAAAGVIHESVDADTTVVVNRNVGSLEGLPAFLMGLVPIIAKLVNKNDDEDEVDEVKKLPSRRVGFVVDEDETKEGE